MNELLVKVFDFSIRITELVGYMEDEKKLFPLKNRLLECAEGICVSLRISHHLPKSTPEYSIQAYKLALEAECLLELMVKTGFMNEVQSEPILTDCRFIKEETGKQLGKKAG